MQQQNYNLAEELVSGATSYEVLEFLGSGSFGQVVKCVNRKTKKVVAIKMVKEQTSFEEVEILNNLRKANADKFNCIRLHEEFEHQNHTCLVFEAMEQNLYDFVSNNKFLPLMAVRPILKQVLTALHTLKELRIIHTDLKPENIMIVDSIRQLYKIKVIDFGCAMYASAAKVNSYITTRYYRSPEVILGLPFCEAIDMWSLGCIAAELFMGCPLYPGSSEYDQIRHITQTQGLPPANMLSSGLNTAKYFCNDGDVTHPDWRLKPSCMQRRHTVVKSLDDIGEIRVPAYVDGNQWWAEQADRREFVDLLERMLSIDPDQRISPADALKHPFTRLTHLAEYLSCPSVKASVQHMEVCSEDGSETDQATTTPDFDCVSGNNCNSPCAKRRYVLIGTPSPTLPQPYIAASPSATNVKESLPFKKRFKV